MRHRSLASLFVILIGSACGKYNRVVVPSDNLPPAADVIIVPGITLNDDGSGIGILRNRVAMDKLLME